MGEARRQLVHGNVHAAFDAPFRGELGSVAHVDEQRRAGRLDAAQLGGVDAAAFTVNSATGAVTFVSTPDFERFWMSCGP